MKLLELITGDDNVTLEPVYIWWAVSLIWYMASITISYFQGHQPNWQDVGIGLAAIFAGVAVAKKMGT